MIAIMPSELTKALEGLRGRRREVCAGATLFHLGDPIRSMHLVQSGVVQLARHNVGGVALILQRAAAGAMLAEASLFADRYHCAAVATEDAVVRVIPRGELTRKLETDSAFSLIWARHLAQEVQRTRLHCEIISMKTVSSRFDAWLSWHGAMPPKGQWGTLASDIGVSPAALYREIAKRRALA